MICPFCKNTKFNLWYLQRDWDFKDEAGQRNYPVSPPQLSTIVCPNCGITMYDADLGGWLDLTNGLNHLVWNESTRQWDTKQVVATSQSNIGLIKALKSLSPEAQKALAELLKEA